VQPFVGHVPTARLLLPLRALRRLHPAQIADIVEGASHDQGEEILSAVEADPELEADVFEELDAHHQVEFIGSKSDQEAAELLAEMAPDDAADLITEVDQRRRRKLVDLLPDEQRRKVTSLLAYNPSTAGGMMSPDFVSVADDASVREALLAVQTSSADLPTQAASVVFALDGEGRLAGSLSVVDLLRAAPDTAIRRVPDEPAAARLQVGDALDEVAQTMSDYNLTAAPVVDPQGRVVGVVTADDHIEAMIPRDWRRRRIASSDD
jgi:Mg/Co/Ni transporter MgtE